jgi:hypothetical protein
MSDPKSVNVSVEEIRLPIFVILKLKLPGASAADN